MAVRLVLSLWNALSFRFDRLILLFIGRQVLFQNEERFPGLNMKYSVFQSQVRSDCEKNLLLGPCITFGEAFPGGTGKFKCLFRESEPLINPISSITKQFLKCG